MTSPSPLAPAAEAEAPGLVHSPTEERNPRTLRIDTEPVPEIIATILAEDARVMEAVAAASGQVARLAEACVAAIATGGRVHYVGAGTSGRLGVLDAVELLPTYNAGPEYVVAHLAGGDGAMMRAVEGAEDSEAEGAALVRESCGAVDLVIGLAASGRTPFVAGALREARERGLVTGLVSANPHAPLAALADIPVLLDTGPEVVTGSTRMKAATAQKIVLNAISTATMIRLGKTYENLMIDVRATNHKLVARTARILVEASGASHEEASAALAATNGDVRASLVLLVASREASGRPSAWADPDSEARPGENPSAGENPGAGAAARLAAEAIRLTAEHPPHPARVGDPSGLRTATAHLRALMTDSPDPLAAHGAS
ncbi:MAG: N-acetylmuramic acid 6-phosphate etherase [Dermabacter sp.]|nr:N-acetylmuramic acid 6-phosphate etherase [Dermabacter sp.]